MKVYRFCTVPHKVYGFPDAPENMLDFVSSDGRIAAEYGDKFVVGEYNASSAHPKLFCRVKEQKHYVCRNVLHCYFFLRHANSAAVQTLDNQGIFLWTEAAVELL